MVGRVKIGRYKKKIRRWPTSLPCQEKESSKVGPQSSPLDPSAYCGSDNQYPKSSPSFFNRIRTSDRLV